MVVDIGMDDAVCSDPPRHRRAAGVLHEGHRLASSDERTPARRPLWEGELSWVFAGKVITASGLQRSPRRGRDAHPPPPPAQQELGPPRAHPLPQVAPLEPPPALRAREASQPAPRVPAPQARGVPRPQVLDRRRVVLELHPPSVPAGLTYLAPKEKPSQRRKARREDHQDPRAPAPPPRLSPRALRLCESLPFLPSRLADGYDPARH